jgi:hypothetical protein
LQTDAIIVMLMAIMASKTKSKRLTVFPMVRAAVGVLILVIASLPAPGAKAAALSTAFVRFDRMQTSTATTGTICAKPTTVATEADVQVTFPTGYTLGASTDFTVSTTNLAWPSGGTAWPSIATATNVTSQVVTFPSGELTVGTLYCFNWTSTAAVTIKSSATSSNSGTITTRTSTPTNIDTSDFSTASVTSDQIAVTATVPSTFSFALSATTDALGNLSTGSITSSPTPRTATVNTNSKNGWQVWAKDANTGLTSATASATIASTTPGTNSTLSIGNAGYNTGVTSSQVGGSGVITVAAPFVGGTTGKGGGLDTSLRSLATSGGTADTAVLTLTNNVAISATTAAASDYADTITVVGAGLF